ncbi:6722_t:CDS:2 [Paraglomus occultum]|uniref:6722_t:CDS:1 n=1 Tax=Paraglomus occultum TaxID=144539 RepID=A0A9N8ZXZ8_9GLOM|nr:6722_t:CDS:2 [Paraglomus occultum]
MEEKLNIQATRADIQRLERGIESLVNQIEKCGIVLGDVDGVQNKESDDLPTMSPRRKSSKNKITITLDVPTVADHNKESDRNAGQNLKALLNRTYPEAVVELVYKLGGRLGFGLNENVQQTENGPVAGTMREEDGGGNVAWGGRGGSAKQWQGIKFTEHGQNQSSPSRLLVLATLTVAASRFSDDPSIQKLDNKPAGIFYDTTKSLLNTMYDVPRLETCQALLLLAHSEVSLSRLDSSYMYLGMAVRMAQALGLDRNETTSSPAEDEERRRVFYCLYTVDRWAGFLFGKPHIITDINVSVPLPTLANFDPMTRDFFISFLKLSRILGSIWNFGYSSQPKASPATWSEQAMDEKSPLRQIRGALAKWLKELPDSLQYQYLPSTDSRDIFQLANFTPFAGHINMLFHTCLILLHQPYLPFSTSTKTLYSSSPLKTCLTAAVTIADIAKTTRQVDPNVFTDFMYSLYGLMQSAILELMIVNEKVEYSASARKAFEETMGELRSVATNLKFGGFADGIRELDEVAGYIIGSDGNIVVPIALASRWLDNGVGNGTCNDIASFSSPQNISVVSSAASSPSAVEDMAIEGSPKLRKTPSKETCLQTGEKRKKYAEKGLAEKRRRNTDEMDQDLTLINNNNEPNETVNMQGHIDRQQQQLPLEDKQPQSQLPQYVNARLPHSHMQTPSTPPSSAPSSSPSSVSSPQAPAPNPIQLFMLPQSTLYSAGPEGVIPSHMQPQISSTIQSQMQPTFQQIQSQFSHTLHSAQVQQNFQSQSIIHQMVPEPWDSGASSFWANDLFFSSPTGELGSIYSISDTEDRGGDNRGN